jgi:hypothetical protein
MDMLSAKGHVIRSVSDQHTPSKSRGKIASQHAHHFVENLSASIVSEV